MESVVSIVFAVESEAFQALSALKKNPVNAGYAISQAVLVKKVEERIVLQDSFDTGMETTDDTRMGGLIGALFGILGGPLGMLLTGGMGALTGSILDADDAAHNISLMEKVAEQFVNGETAIIALAQEADPAALEASLSRFQTTIVREDAAEVAAEIRHAQEVQKEIEREARKRLREEKKETRKKEIEDRREKIKADFEALKNKLSGKD